MDSEPIDEHRILRRLKTRWFGRSLRIVDECSSTNDLVERIAEDRAPHGLVVVAESQTSGRGRLGRDWYSPRGGVWMSILIRPQGHPSYVTSLPLVGALGIAKSLVKTLGIKARVRWPNDVVVDRRKIAGVLVESKSKGNELVYAVLGLGINANFDTSKIDSIRGTATSLLRLLGGAVNRESLILAVLSETERMYESLCASGGEDLLPLLRELDCSRGSNVKVRTEDREFVGMVDDYESLSRVRIMTPDGSESVDTSALVSVDYQSD